MEQQPFSSDVTHSGRNAQTRVNVGKLKNHYQFTTSRLISKWEGNRNPQNSSEGCRAISQGKTIHLIIISMLAFHYPLSLKRSWEMKPISQIPSIHHYLFDTSFPPGAWHQKNGRCVNKVSWPSYEWHEDGQSFNRQTTMSTGTTTTTIHRSVKAITKHLFFLLSCPEALHHFPLKTTRSL